MTAIEYIPLGIYIVVYSIVFIIQKAQNDKQKSIMEKYEKMFSIINIDEIEKYVNLKEQSLKLNFEVREKEIDKLEKSINLHLIKSEKLVEDLGTLKDEKIRIETFGDNIEKMVNDSKVFNLAINDIYTEEFNEIYDFLKVKLKTVGKFDAIKIDLELKNIRKEFEIKKLEILTKLEVPKY
jgi:hypothetical protein